jgi:hypothetical protein
MFFFNFSFIMVCGLEHVIVSNLERSDAENLDTFFLWVGSITWLFVHAVLLIMGGCGSIRPDWSDEAKRYMVADWSRRIDGVSSNTKALKV